MTDQAVATPAPSTRSASGPSDRPASGAPVVSRLLGWLAAPPLATRYGLRYAAAVALALWLSARFALPHGFWILIAIVVCMQPFEGAAVQKGGYRVAGTVAGGLAAVAFAFVAQETPALLLLGLFLVATVASYGQMTSSRPYAYTLLNTVFLIVIGDAAGTSDLSEIFNLTFVRVSLTILGVVIVAVFSAFLWPTRAGEELSRLLTQGACNLGRLFDKALRAPPAQAEGPTDPPGPETDGAAAQQDFSREMALARQAVHEDVGDRTHYRRAARQIALLEDLRSIGQKLVTATERMHSLSDEAALALGEVRRRFERALSSIAEALQDVGGDAGIARGAIEELRVGVEQLARVPLEPENRNSFADLAEMLRWAVQDLEMLAAASPGGRSDRPAADRASLGAPRFAIDPAVGRVALRAGVATAAALLANMAVALPVSPATPLIAFSLTSTPARLPGKALLKLYAVFVVISLVAAANMVFVTPNMQRFPGALLVPAAMFFALGYGVVQRPKLAGLAPTVGLVLALLLFTGPTAPTNLVGPWMLLQWLAVVVVVCFIVNLLIWPRTALDLFRRKSAAQLDLLRRRLTDPESGAGPAELNAAFLTGAVSSAKFSAAAQGEPVQEALDADRRASLLVVLSRLNEVVLALERERLGTPGNGDCRGEAPERAPAERGEVVSEVAASMERLAGMLRGDASALKAYPAGAGSSRLGGESDVGAASEPPGTAAPEPGSRSEVRGPLQGLREAQQRLETWEHDWITARTADGKGTRA